MATREVRRAPSRATEVVDVAAQLFFEQGYESTTIQDLADRLGILKGSVYHYIATKEDLLFAIVKTIHEEGLANVATVRETDADLITKIRQLITRHIELLIRERVKVSVVLHDFRSLSKPRQNEVNMMRVQLSKYLQELIAEGQEEGVVWDEVEPWLLGLGILGMLNWTYEWYRPTNREGSKKIVKGLVDLAMRSIDIPEKSQKKASSKSRAAR